MAPTTDTTTTEPLVPVVLMLTTGVYLIGLLVHDLQTSMVVSNPYLISTDAAGQPVLSRWMLHTKIPVFSIYAEHILTVGLPEESLVKQYMPLAEAEITSLNLSPKKPAPAVGAEMFQQVMKQWASAKK